MKRSQGLTSGAEQLRDRAVLYEYEKASTSKRSKWTKPSSVYVPQLDEAQRVLYPGLVPCLEHHLEFRCPARSHEPLKRFMERVLKGGDELVLLTQQIDRCEGLSLFKPDDKRIIRQASRATVYQFLSVYAQRTQALSVVIQKDSEGRVHHHGLTTLSTLPKAMQQQLEEVSRGPGGGTVLNNLGELHGVIANKQPLDLERIARYLSRFPDDRLDLHPLADGHLQLLEELASRQLSKVLEKHSQVRLAWECPRQWKTVLKKDHAAEKRRGGSSSLIDLDVGWQ